MDLEKREKFIEEGTGDINADIKTLNMTPSQRVHDLLKRIELEFVYDDVTEGELKSTYKSLLAKLASIPGLLESDRTQLSSVIEEKMSKASELEVKPFELIDVGDIDRDIENLGMTPMERISDLLDRIEFEHMYGDVTEMELQALYSSLINKFNSTPGLSESDIKQLNSQIKEHMKQTTLNGFKRIQDFLNNEAKINEAAKDLAITENIPEKDARRIILTDLQEQYQEYSKMIENDQKSQSDGNIGVEPNDDSDAR